ncbi:MAG: ABC transporter substrate-binding protein [Micromonosporaceae bacterium]
MTDAKRAGSPSIQNSALSRRGFLGLTGGVGLAMGLTACGGGSTGASGSGAKYTGPKVSLDFWNGFTGGDGPVMKELVRKFNAEHKNITVKMTVYEWATYYEKTPAAVASGKAPDVGIMHVDSLATNAARGVILPLDDLSQTLKLSAGDFAEAVWTAGEYKGHRYGIPLDVHPLGFFYNKTVMEKAKLDPESPPQTADEYASALDALQQAGIEGMWMTPHQFTASMTFQSLLWQHGGELFNADATAASFGEDAGVKALTWMVDLVKDGHSRKDVGQDADVTAFQNNKTAFNWNGIWAINTYRENKDLNWGVAPLPQIGPEKGAWAGSHNFVLLKQRERDDNKLSAAKVFVNWISQQSLEWAKGGQVPARKSVRESDGFAALAEQAAIGEQVDYLRFPPATPGIGEAIEPMNDAINLAVLLKKSPSQALSEGAEKASQILEENAKKYQ